MPARNDLLEQRLSEDHEIHITVKGRKSGRDRALPIWFVFDAGTLYLLPVRGSDTPWYKDVLRNPSIGVDAQAMQARFRVVPVTDHTQVSLIIEKFRAKYGDAGVRLYSKLDVAVVGKPG